MASISGLSRRTCPVQISSPFLFPSQLSPPPFAIKTQIYSLLPDRTAVDRSLHALVRSGVIRAFHLPTSSRTAGDVLLALTDDIVDTVRREDPAVAVPLRAAFMASRRETATRAVLLTALSKVLGSSDTSLHGNDPERSMDILLRSGWLSRHPADMDMFRYSLPKAGQIVKSIDGGRKVSTIVVAVAETLNAFSDLSC